MGRGHPRVVLDACCRVWPLLVKKLLEKLPAGGIAHCSNGEPRSGSVVRRGEEEEDGEEAGKRRDPLALTGGGGAGRGCLSG